MSRKNYSRKPAASTSEKTPSRKSRAGSSKSTRRFSKLSEILFLLVLFTALFLAVALLGFNQDDESDWLGQFGADTAKFVSVLTFGWWGAFSLPLAMFLILISRLSGGRFRSGRWIGTVLAAGFFIGFGIAFVRLWVGIDADFLISGIPSTELARLSETCLQRWGTLLVAAAVILTLGVLLLDLRPTTLASALFYRTPVGMWRGIAAGTKGVFSIVRRKEPRIPRTAAVAAAEEAESSTLPTDTMTIKPRERSVSEISTEPPLSGRDDGALAATSGTRELPPLRLLNMPPADQPAVDPAELAENSWRLEEKLANLGVTASVIKTNPGPIITRYDLEPAAEVKIARIVNLVDDIAMALRARGVRILAPIPGEAAVGIEIPNRTPQLVYIREVIGSDEFRASRSPLTIAFGKDTNGGIFCQDLAEMPHLLIAGATGSGKSVCINVIISSLLFRSDPRDVRLVLIDPKKLELSLYSRLSGQHLVVPPGLDEQVITAPENAVSALRSVHAEMERRYEVLAEAGVRGLDEYNRWIESTAPTEPGETDTRERLPYLIIIIDELADLMITVRREFEDLVVRLAQMSRAVGIHLVVATQRPSVDVVTGLIKANFPSRIAFQVASRVDSRTIIDSIGAEALLGRGDMLYQGPGSSQLVRLHGALVTTEEIEQVVEFVRAQPPCESKFALPYPEAARFKPPRTEGEAGEYSQDELFEEAAKIVVRSEQGSVSVLQRRLRVGYARAARLIDELERAGVVGPFDGSKARHVLMTPEELQERFGI